MRLLQHFSRGSLVVMAITFVLFTSALATETFTRDVLLEAAVFLVSANLMLLAHGNRMQARAMDANLDRI